MALGTTRLAITPTQPQPVFIVIDGREYEVSYEELQADGSWVPVSRNLDRAEIENRVGQIFAKTQDQIRAKLDSAKAGEDTIFMHFSKAHEFVDLTFEHFDGRNTKTDSFGLTDNAKPIFDAQHFGTKGQATAELRTSYQQLNQLSKRLADPKADPLARTIQGPAKFPPKPRLSSDPSNSSTSFRAKAPKQAASAGVEIAADFIQDNGARGDCGPLSILAELARKKITHSKIKMNVNKEQRILQVRTVAVDYFKSKKDDICKDKDPTGLMGMIIHDLNNIPSKDSKLIKLLQQYKNSDQKKTRKALFDYYCKYIAIPGSFVDRAFFEAFSKALQKDRGTTYPIVILRPTSIGNGHHIAETYPVDGRTKELTPENTLFLVYDAPVERGGGTHYQSIAPKKKNAKFDQAVKALIAQHNVDEALRFFRNCSTENDDISKSKFASLAQSDPTVYKAICLAIYQEYYNSRIGDDKSRKIKFASNLIQKSSSTLKMLAENRGFVSSVVAILQGKTGSIPLPVAEDDEEGEDDDGDSESSRPASRSSSPAPSTKAPKQPSFPAPSRTASKLVSPPVAAKKQTSSRISSESMRRVTIMDGPEDDASPQSEDQDSAPLIGEPKAKKESRLQKVGHWVKRTFDRSDAEPQAKSFATMLSDEDAIPRQSFSVMSESDDDAGASSGSESQ